ncbi:hypothetical protein PWP93_36610 [Paraburkholderia sp. A1RI-2L]|uniref:hypothetical protein n=1 Tax=Paraburkholderia sp. A1RI-2L TaxID=3028367 RepID=UPI003B7E4AD7
MNKTTGLLPIVDGPWKGGQVAHALGTFETDGDEMATPLPFALPGVGRVRYYRQEGESGLVWSVQIPPNAADLLHEEEADIQRLIG